MGDPLDAPRKGPRPIATTMALLRKLFPPSCQKTALSDESDCGHPLQHYSGKTPRIGSGRFGRFPSVWKCWPHSPGRMNLDVIELRHQDVSAAFRSPGRSECLPRAARLAPRRGSSCFSRPPRAKLRLCEPSKLPTATTRLIVRAVPAPTKIHPKAEYAVF